MWTWFNHDTVLLMSFLTAWRNCLRNGSPEEPDLEARALATASLTSVSRLHIISHAVSGYLV
jgi:hypothetical protein